MRRIPTLRRILRPLLAAVLLGVSAPGAHAAVVASDTAFPVWRGVVNGAPGVGHQIDCTNTNPYFGAKGCAVDVHTVSSGRNCAYEIITASQGTFGSTFHQTPCAVSITGSITFAPTPAGCVYTGHRLTMSWESGINSTCSA